MNSTEQHNHWSSDDIEAYCNGSLSEERAHLLERDLLDDPFLAEAVEGYQAAGAPIDTASLDEKWAQRQSDSKHAAKGGFGKGLYLGILAVAGLILFWTWQRGFETHNISEELGQVKEALQEQKEIQLDSLNYVEIDLALPVSEVIEIRPKQTLEDQQQIHDFEEQVAQTPLTDRPPVPEPLPKMGQDSANEFEEKQILEPSHPIFYLHDFKLADLRSEYEGDFYLVGEWMSGTAAKFEREEEKLSQVGQFDQRSYEDLLDEAMSLFKSRDYKHALLLFSKIERKHPDDVNALFYGGLCYFNLSKWNKAELRLRRAMNHHIAVFDQEAEWCFAHSLLSRNELERAEKILSRVARDGGFYAERARVLLVDSVRPK